LSFRFFYNDVIISSVLDPLQTPVQKKSIYRDANDAHSFGFALGELSLCPKHHECTEHDLYYHRGTTDSGPHDLGPTNAGSPCRLLG
jgi:hypothetical protein